MAKFARLIEVNDYQVLLYVDVKNEDFVAHVVTHLDDYMAELKLSYSQREAAMEYIEDFTDERAKDFINDCLRKFS